MVSWITVVGGIRWHSSPKFAHSASSETYETMKTKSDYVLADRIEDSLWIELRRTERCNAYTEEMLWAIEALVSDANLDESVRTVVFVGAGGRAFCAGADLGEIAARSWKSVLSLTSARIFSLIQEARAVTIAALNGVAVGGGLELALACDIRLAASHASMWLPEPSIGLLPAAGALHRLPQLVGAGRAKELIVGGAVWDAATAQSAGLVAEVVPAPKLRATVDGWTQRIGSRDAAATYLAKQTLNGRVGDGGHDLVAQSLLVQLRNPRRH